MMLRNKIIVMILAITMVFTLVPATAFAENAGDNPEPGIALTTDDGEGEPDPELPPEEPKQGFVTENNYTYYYEDGEKVTGRQYLEKDGTKSYFYFNTNGVMQTGLKSIDGHIYYYESDGREARGLVSINGKKFYFSPYRKTGCIKINGKLHYFYNSSNCHYMTTKKGWFTGSDGAKRYGLGNGVIATGVKKIGSTPYYFYKSSGKRHAKGWFTANGYKYYCKGQGELVTGWKVIKEGAYYFKSSGKLARNTTVGHLKIPKSGNCGKTYAMGIKALNKTGWNLRAAYNFAANTRYANRQMRRDNSLAYAKYGFTNRYGNCYVMAGQFFVMAKLLGYDVRQVYGKVAMPHSWTEIKHGSKRYVYDPNFTNETGRNGYKIYYGKRGTWRYTKFGNVPER